MKNHQNFHPTLPIVPLDFISLNLSNTFPPAPLISCSTDTLLSNSKHGSTSFLSPLFLLTPPTTEEKSSHFCDWFHHQVWVPALAESSKVQESSSHAIIFRPSPLTSCHPSTPGLLPLCHPITLTSYFIKTVRPPDLHSSSWFSAPWTLPTYSLTSLSFTEKDHTLPSSWS